MMETMQSLKEMSFNRDMYRLLKRLVKWPKRKYYKVKKFLLNFDAMVYLDNVKEKYALRFRRQLQIYKELKFMYQYERWFLKYWWYTFFWGSLLKNEEKLRSKLDSLKKEYPNDLREQLYVYYLAEENEDITYKSEDIDRTKETWDRVRAYYGVKLDELRKWRSDVPEEYFQDKGKVMRKKFEEFVKKVRIKNKLRIRDRYIKVLELRLSRAKETRFNDFKTAEKITKQPRNVVS